MINVSHKDIDYLQAATSLHTRAAYQSDIRDYLEKFAHPLPVSIEHIVAYLR